MLKISLNLPASSAACASALSAASAGGQTDDVDMGMALAPLPRADARRGRRGLMMQPESCCHTGIKGIETKGKSMFDILEAVGLDLNKQTVSGLMDTTREITGSGTFKMLPRDSKGNVLGLLLVCTDARLAQKLNAFIEKEEDGA